MKKILLILFFWGNLLSLGAQSHYNNPILHADYSDPDVCRVGDDFYLTASSFNCVPGLPVLHSRDLVHWNLLGYALPNGLEPKEVFAKPQHGKGVWAPAIRYHNDKFYIFWGDPDYGIFQVSSADAMTWSKPQLVKAGQGLIDPCPFWDSDGKAYLVHAWAGSRAHIKSLLALAEMHPDATHLLGPSRVIFDGHRDHPTIEGPKMYKRNEYYYILAPAGGVKTGWQLALRSLSPWGPFEEQIVMQQGDSPINGPHQGALVDLPSGESWFVHFQDKDAYGRIVHLNPVDWKKDWPVMGDAPRKELTGTPVDKHKSPKTTKSEKFVADKSSDDFSKNALSLSWQWQANPESWWHFVDAKQGQLRLFAVPQADDYRSLWDSPNLLLQKFPAENFEVNTLLHFQASAADEEAGFVIMGQDYLSLRLQKTPQGLLLSKGLCHNAHKGETESVQTLQILPTDSLYIRLQVKAIASETNTSKVDALCSLSYSLDGKEYIPLPNFTAKAGRWIGAKFGLYCNRKHHNNDAGWLNVMSPFQVKY